MLKHGLGKLVAVLLSVFLVVFTVRTGIEAWNLYRGTETYDNTITISGTGTVETIPDLAQVYFSVISEAESPEEAELDGNVRMNNIIEALKGMGIEDRDLKTTRFDLYPQYDFRPFDELTSDDEEFERIIGYTLEQSLEVRVRDTEKAGTVVKTATAQGANQVGGVEFVVDDPEIFRDEARIEAFQKARAKAELLADQAGVRLGDVVTFYEDEYGFEPYYDDFARAETFTLEAASAPAPTFEAGEEEISVTVTMVFEIR